jgi:beta-lactamase class A
VTRRSLLVGAASGFGLLVVGCGHSSPPKPLASTRTSTAPSVEAQLAELERRFGGRIGVHAVDTATEAHVSYRAGERFLLCSTYKAFAAAAVLRRAESDPALLARVVRYDRSRLISHSPVTMVNANRGMTVAELCDAAMTMSDNTAANLLLETLGGPSRVTAFLRTLGDDVTRLDRTEPTLNVAADGDVRDTTTPAAAAQDLRALAIGDALRPASRAQLVRWLNANTTGGALIRAGLPSSWVEGDRSGGGTDGQTNDMAVATPPGRPPLVMAVYTAPADPQATTGSATVAAAARIVARALGAH